MKHHLILFYGSSSGAGKSTLSSRLHQALKQANVPARWLYERDVLHLDLFAPVMDYMRGEGYADMPSACLAATTRLVAAYGDRARVVIADSILPYYDWLLAAGYDEATLQSFNQQLQEVVHPLTPLIVYLQADIATVLQRAVDQRGEQWLRDLIPSMNTWAANKEARISDQSDVIAYLQRTERQKIALLSAWAGEILWLDTVQTSIDACATTLLNYLELPALPAAERPLSPALLDRYVGHYTTTDPDPPDGERNLVISLRNDELWVSLYWPNGCRLVAEGENCFQLQATSHRIEFSDPTAENGGQLRYHYTGKRYTYQKFENVQE